eukprot:1820350-Pyramimonas_sp.AAC.1
MSKSTGVSEAVSSSPYADSKSRLESWFIRRPDGLVLAGPLVVVSLPALGFLCLGQPWRVLLGAELALAPIGKPKVAVRAAGL